MADARVFVVDDQEANVRLLEQLLDRAGFGNVRTFRDGGSMLDALAADEPDLILLDLHMPAPDGFAVLAALEARASDDDYLPVLVLTGDAERTARSRALMGGAKDFLLKPFDVEEVVLRVRNLLETRLLHGAIRARNSELVAEVASLASDLHESETRWADVAASLGRLETLASPERTADAICDALARLPDLALVSILAFGADGTVVPLTVRATVRVLFDPDRPVPDAWSRRIRRRVSGGTWFASSSSLDDATGRLFDRDVTAAVLVPLRASGEPVGAIVAAATGADGPARLARRVSHLEAFAALTAALVGPGLAERKHGGHLRERIGTIISNGGFRPVFQPIVALDPIATVGYEALTRFADGVAPDVRFADAAGVGMSIELERACLSAALRAAARSIGPDSWLSLNVSPAMVLETERLAGVLRDAPAPIVLEITEHTPIADYGAFRAAIRSLGPSVRCAVDDAGAGFASFRHILELGPDFVKLDVGLVRAIERDPARQALVAGMVHFAKRTGTTLIAEGIETTAERDALQALAVDFGQGYLLGPPAAVDAIASEPRPMSIGPRRPAPARGKDRQPVGR
jgi:EAL domain-containing protein (putative c-di-GMP-specific phosphodiesterase class I)/DNA-binding response OmpR family regulator